MGRARKKPVYLILEAEILVSVGKDRVLAFDTNPDDHLMDELQCPVFDEVLIALRRSFSLTYPRNPFIDGLNEALHEIRRISVETLRIFPEVVKELNLKPLPAPSTDKNDSKVYVLKYCLVRASDLEVKVTYEGKTSKLISLIECRPADDLIRTLREVVSDTFQEMFDEDQHEAALRQIRKRIGSILPAFNDLLVAIEIEPIADMSVFDNADSENSLESDSSDSGHSTSSNSVGTTPSSGNPSPK